MPKTKVSLGQILNAYNRNAGDIKKITEELHVTKSAVQTRLRKQKIKVYKDSLGYYAFVSNHVDRGKFFDEQKML